MKSKFYFFLAPIGLLVVFGGIYFRDRSNPSLETSKINDTPINTASTDSKSVKITSISESAPAVPAQEKNLSKHANEMTLDQRIHPSLGNLIKKDNVLASRDGAARADGSFQRISLVRTSLKYPLVKIFQEIGRDPQTGSQIIIRESAVIADHVMVTLKEGQSRQDLEYTISKMGGAIRSFLPTTKVYLVSFETGDDLDSLDRFYDQLKTQKDLVKKINKDHLGHI